MVSRSLLLSFLCYFAALGSALAQWRTESFNLVPGWQAIHLRVDTDNALIDNLLVTYPQIEEVWRWRPDSLDERILDSPDAPVTGAEWEVWRKGQLGNSTLAVLSPHSSYLVKVANGSPAFSLRVKGRVVAPRVQWRTDGLNLLGFPVKSGTSPTVSAYFEGAEVLEQTTEIYAYQGGPLVTDVNPAKLTPRFGRVKRGTAYWVRTAKFLDYDGPLRVRAALGDGLNFGNSVPAVRLVLTNRSSGSLDAVLASAASEASPAGGGVPALVPLTISQVNQDGERVFVPMPEPHTITLEAGETRGVTLGVNRALLAGSPGDQALSLLKVTDGNDLTENYVPVRAEVASIAGLWVGRAEVTHVQNQLQRFQKDDQGNYLVGPDNRHLPEYKKNQEGELILDDQDNPIPVEDKELNETAQTFPLDLIVHVDESGKARVLSMLYHGVIALDADSTPIFGLVKDEDRLLEDYLDRATRYSVVHLPVSADVAMSGTFGAGAPISGSLVIAHDSPENPFIHTYHPDHDNLDARFEQSLPSGIESFRIDRRIGLSIDSGPGGLNDPSWGTTLLTGSYSETLRGLHKNPVAIAGQFALRKISDIPVISHP